MARPDYWWYVARAGLLDAVLAGFVGSPVRVLDVGSADGPSVGWLRRHDGLHTTLDIDPRGLSAGGVCGSVLALPFPDATFDVVAAFDVLEHCEPEASALAELSRVLAPGGRLLLSVPAYQWAWTEFDEINSHHRRYTRPRAVRAVEAAGLTVERATYMFAATFPFFVAERAARRAGQSLTRRPEAPPADVVDLPSVPGWVSRTLLWLCTLDRRVLRRRDLPFGSSVVLAARRPRGT